MDGRLFDAPRPRAFAFLLLVMAIRRNATRQVMKKRKDAKSQSINWPNDPTLVGNRQGIAIDQSIAGKPHSKSIIREICVIRGLTSVGFVAMVGGLNRSTIPAV